MQTSVSQPWFHKRLRAMASAAAAFFACVLMAQPALALLPNELQFTKDVDVNFATADTGVLTRVVESSGAKVSFVDVRTDYMEITLDAGSLMTLTAVGANRRLVITRQSGSHDFSVSPSCPTTTATLSGTGATTVLRVQVVTTSGCTEAGADSPTAVVEPGTGTASGSSGTDAAAGGLAALGVQSHDLIKLPNDNNPKTQEDSTVYYVGADGRRHAFPDSRVYFSWYCDFSLVKTVPADAMAKIPLGKNVTYRSGLRLVKFVSVPTVYLVQPQATLRAIGDEASAAALMGEDWAKKVSDITDGNYTDYRIGEPLPAVTAADASAYDISATYPSASMGITGYVDPGNVGGTMHCAAAAPSAPVTLSLAHGSLPLIPDTFTFQDLLSVNTFDSQQVRYLQMLLSALGKDIYPEQVVNGNFGPATQAAVRRFQAANGIDQKGYVGEMTRAALNALLQQAR